MSIDLDLPNFRAKQHDGLRQWADHMKICGWSGRDIKLSTKLSDNSIHICLEALDAALQLFAPAGDDMNKKQTRPSRRPQDNDAGSALTRQW